MSNLDLKASFDVSGAQAAAISLRNSLKDLTSQANALDAQIKAAGAGATENMRVSFVSLGEQIASTQKRLNEARAGVQSFTRTATEGIGGMHGSLSTATREFRALFDELSSGRTRMTPGTLAIIGQRVLGLGPAALGAVGGAVALAGALGYLAVEGMKASSALAEIPTAAKFAGNFDLTRQQIAELVAELGKLPWMTNADARETVAAFASIKNGTTPELRALSAEVADYAQASRQDLDKARETFIKAFSDPVAEAKKFVQSFGGVTQAQIDAAEAAQRSGDANKAAAVMIEVLDTAMKGLRPAMDEQNGRMFQSIANLGAYIGLMNEGIGWDDAQTAAIERQNAARQRQADIIAWSLNQMKTAPPTPQQQAATLVTGVAAAESADQNTTQTKAAQGEIDKINAGLAVARATADQVNVDRLEKGLTAAKQRLDELKFGPVLEQARAEVAKLAQSWDGTRSGLDKAEAGVWSKYLSQVRAGSSQALAIVTEAAHAETAARRAAGEEAIASARDQVARISGDVSKGDVDRLAGEQQVWARLVAGEQLTGKLRLDAQKDLDQATAALNKARSQQTLEINREDLAADIEIAKYKLEAAKANLAEDLAAHRITAARKTDILKQLTAAEYAEDIKQLDAELATLQAGTAAYQKTYDQIRVLRAKLGVDLAQADRQGAEEAKRELETQRQQWKQVFDQIDGAAKTFFNDILEGHKKVGVAAEQAAGKMLATWIEDLAEMGLKFAAFEAATLLGWTKIAAAIGNPFDANASGIGGLIGGIFGSGNSGGAISAASGIAGKVDDTALAANVAQLNTTMTAANAASTLNTTNLGLSTTATDANTVTGLGTNTTGLASNTLGVGSNTTALAANTAALQASSATSGASAGGSLIDGIPIIGTVAKILGFDEGAWSIPSATLGILHPGEMVLPPPVAATARATGTIGSFASGRPQGSGAAGQQIVINISHAPQVTSLNAKDTLTALKSPAVLNGLTKAIQYELAKNISLRGNF